MKQVISKILVIIILATTLGTVCGLETFADQAQAASSYTSNPLLKSQLKVNVFNDGSVYANNSDYREIEVIAYNYLKSPLINQPLSIRLPAGVSFTGTLNTQNGLTKLYFRSSRAVSANISIRLTNRPSVYKNIRITFKPVVRRIRNLTDPRSFNVNCPITFIAESSTGANFTRAEVVYDYNRLINRIYGKSKEKRRVIVPMSKENDQWIGTLGGDNTNEGRVSGLRFSYYFRFYDANGRAYQSRRYYSKLYTNR